VAHVTFTCPSGHLLTLSWGNFGSHTFVIEARCDECGFDGSLRGRGRVRSGEDAAAIYGEMLRVTRDLENTPAFAPEGPQEARQ
jgi:hypothetical protein